MPLHKSYTANNVRYCVYCSQHKDDHVAQQCLFMPTRFRQPTVDRINTVIMSTLNRPNNADTREWFLKTRIARVSALKGKQTLRANNVLYITLTSKGHEDLVWAVPLHDLMESE